jgi:AAA domain-containing protein
VPRPTDLPFVLPEEKREGDDFTFLWREQRIAIGFRSVRVNRQNKIDTEISVVTIKPDGTKTGLLEWGDLTLSSLSQRETLERSLRQQTADCPVLDFDRALRHVCWRTAEEYKKGGPFVRLAETDIKRTRSFAFRGMCPRGEVSTYYGDGEGGKSLTSMLLAISYVTNQPLADGIFQPEPLDERPNALYLDWEASEDEHGYRFDALLRGNGLTGLPPGLIYRFQQRTLGRSARRWTSSASGSSSWTRWAWRAATCSTRTP